MTERREDGREARVDLTVWALAALTLAVHLLTAKGYGYFRDELYYLANGEHLGFGYVEHPPLIGLVAAFVRATLGTSLVAIRLLPTLAAAATVWLAGAMARDLGGRRYAQGLAAAATMLAPIYVSLFSILSMNSFDVLFWALGIWLMIRILGGGDRRLWLVFGLVAGLGLENKLSIAFLALGVAAGLAAARRWDVLRSGFPWLGGAVAVVLVLPYLIWQRAHGWPLLEFMHHARELKNVGMSPLAFMREQVLLANPLALPLWGAGLVFLLAAKRAGPFRPLGFAYPAILAIMLIAGNAKPYYLAPIYTLLFAGGAVAIEAWTTTRWRLTARVAVAGLVVLGGVLTAPLAKPLLGEDTFVRYAAALGVKAAAEERHAMGRLPQFFADMHGWPELAETVGRVFHALPPEDQARACIFAGNYGQAGAIDLFGPRLGLPKAIAGHNSYFLWGPRQCTGEVVVIIGGRPDELRQQFRALERGATHTCTDCMPYENHRPIWVGRDPKRPLGEVWPTLKSYI